MSIKIQNFLKEKKMKQEEIKKAVTAAAATVPAKTDEATMNGENKPSIEGTKTASEIAAQAAPAAPAPTETPAPAAEAAPATVVEEAPPKEEEKPAKKEISFDGLFADEVQIGSVLRQSPNGGNVMTNVRPAAMDYVERAKNHKNQAMSAEELAKLQAEKK